MNRNAASSKQKSNKKNLDSSIEQSRKSKTTKKQSSLGAYGKQTSKNLRNNDTTDRDSSVESHKTKKKDDKASHLHSNKAQGIKKNSKSIVSGKSDQETEDERPTRSKGLINMAKSKSGYKKRNSKKESEEESGEERNGTRLPYKSSTKPKVKNKEISEDDESEEEAVLFKSSYGKNKKIQDVNKASSSKPTKRGQIIPIKVNKTSANKKDETEESEDDEESSDNEKSFEISRKKVPYQKNQIIVQNKITKVFKQQEISDEREQDDIDYNSPDSPSRTTQPLPIDNIQTTPLPSKPVNKIKSKQKDENKINQNKNHEKPSLKQYSFGKYIYAIFKQIHPEQEFSQRAMNVMNSFVNDIAERLAFEASILARYRGSNQLNELDIRAAVRLVIPGELAKHSIKEGSKAIIKYKASYEKKS